MIAVDIKLNLSRDYASESRNYRIGIYAYVVFVLYAFDF